MSKYVNDLKPVKYTHVVGRSSDEYQITMYFF